MFDKNWSRIAECFEVAVLEPSLRYLSALNLVEVYGYLGNRERQLTMLTAAFAATTEPEVCCDKAVYFGNESSVSSELAFRAFDIADKCPSTLGRSIHARIIRLAEHRRVDDVILVLEQLGARIEASEFDQVLATRLAEIASDAQFEAAELLPLREDRCRLIGASWAGRQGANSENFAKIEACRVPDLPRPRRHPPKQVNVQVPKPRPRPPVRRLPPAPPPIPYATVAAGIGAFADDDVKAVTTLRLNAGLAFFRPELRLFVAASVGVGIDKNTISATFDRAAIMGYFDVGVGVEFLLVGADRAGLFIQTRAAFQWQQERCLKYSNFGGCDEYEEIADSGLLVAGQLSYRQDSIFVGAEVAWSEAMNVGGFLMLGYFL